MKGGEIRMDVKNRPGSIPEQPVEPKLTPSHLHQELQASREQISILMSRMDKLEKLLYNYGIE